MPWRLGGRQHDIVTTPRGMWEGGVLLPGALGMTDLRLLHGHMPHIGCYVNED